jgi:hypothetical protein
MLDTHLPSSFFYVMLVQMLGFSRAWLESCGCLQHISSPRGARHYLSELTLFAAHH